MTDKPRPRTTGSDQTPSRYRRLSEDEVLWQEQYLIDRRFVLECQRMEREGRVYNRVTLERDLGMNKGTLANIRKGIMGIRAVHIKRLRDIYNADHNYILFGVRDLDHSGPLRWDKDLRKAVKLDKYDAYTQVYAVTAAWKAGPHPEDDPGHFPPDPLNLEHPARKAAQEAGEETPDDDSGEGGDEPAEADRGKFSLALV